MLNQIFQTLLLSFTAVILTTGITFGSPFPNGILMADHIPSHQMETVQQSPSGNSNGAFQKGNANGVQKEQNRDRNQQQPQTNQPSQANPSVPYDPYDFDAIRQMNRDIYGEVQGKNQN